MTNLPSRARVVVIGGGVGGASTFYHLTEMGWTDVVLVERDELASGSTWHAAGQVTQFGAVQTMVGLKKYSVELYTRLAADPESPITYRRDDGGIRLGYDQSDLDGYRHFVGVAKGMGVDFEVLSPSEMAELHPLLNVEGLTCGLCQIQTYRWDFFLEASVFSPADSSSTRSTSSSSVIPVIR